MVLLAKSSGLSAPFSWNCLTTPGWPIAARSGGLPPCTAVLSTVGVLSPAGLYFTLTFGYCFLNPSMTAWKDFCSSPVQMPTSEMLPETLLAALAVVLLPPDEDELLLSSLPPHPAATNADAASATSAPAPKR